MSKPSPYDFVESTVIATGDTEADVSTNHVFTNSERRACGIKTLALLGPIVSAAEVDQIRQIDTRSKRLWAERTKWAPDAAVAEIKRRQDELMRNPSDEAIAAVSLESDEELKARYAGTSDSMTRAHSAFIGQYTPFFSSILKRFAGRLEGHLSEMESDHSKACQRYGVTYDRNKDALLKSVANLRTAAIQTSKCPVVTPDSVFNILGDLTA